MRFILVFILIVAGLAAVPFHTSDAYQPAEYEIVTVRAGDDLWSLADKYINDSHDIRQYLAVVYKVNNLQKNDNVYPGQKLKFPLLK